NKRNIGNLCRPGSRLPRRAEYAHPGTPGCRLRLAIDAAGQCRGPAIGDEPGADVLLAELAGRGNRETVDVRRHVAFQRPPVQPGIEGRPRALAAGPG